MISERPRRPWDRVSAEEREYFETLGDGLVVHLPGRPEGNPSARGWAPPSGGAWIHVGSDGTIRAFTGKAEVGQGTRTALGLVVAEELRVPLDRIELIMADTDLSPWDMGTFGSRSMPDAAPALRAVASGAREALIDLAASRGLGSRTNLSANGGEVRTQGATGGIAYGDLVKGLRRRVAITADIPSTPATRWKLAGHAAVDPRGVEVVTGHRVYVSDLRIPDMLYGAALLPPSYGARLVRADTSAVGDGDRVRVIRDGELVGVVAATPREAHVAMAKIRAQWAETEQPAEKHIEAYLRAHPQSGDDWDTEDQRVGDADRALARASVTLEATYRTAYIAHVPLETRAAVASWEGPRVTIWLGTQTPFRAREHVARELGVALEDVRIVVPPTGGGFGGKHGGDVALASARLARAAGRPVRLSYSREEEFQYGYLRPMAIIDVRAGADPEGRLSGWVFHNVNAGAAALLPPYRIPDQRVDNELSASPLPQGPYRALAANANNFARESAIDELAVRLKLDPLVMRERNLDDDRLTAVLDRTTRAAGWKAWSPRAGRGHGVAIGREKGGRIATVAEVSVGEDASLRVDRLVSAFEAGAIVHPENLRSQVEGATIMAMGGALFESVHFDRGRILNPRLSEYRVPRFPDLPEVETILIDRPDMPSAGAGETPMIAVAPAIANAVFDATGLRLRALPLLTGGKLPRLPPAA